MFSVGSINLWGCHLSAEFTLTLCVMLAESAQISWNYYSRFGWVLADFSRFCLETICWYVFQECCPIHSLFIWRYFFNLFFSALLFIVHSLFIYIYWWMSLYSTLPAFSMFPVPFCLPVSLSDFLPRPRCFCFFSRQSSQINKAKNKQNTPALKKIRKQTKQNPLYLFSHICPRKLPAHLGLLLTHSLFTSAYVPFI